MSTRTCLNLRSTWPGVRCLGQCVLTPASARRQMSCLLAAPLPPSPPPPPPKHARHRHDAQLGDARGNPHEACCLHSAMLHCPLLLLLAVCWPLRLRPCPLPPASPHAPSSCPTPSSPAPLPLPLACRTLMYPSRACIRQVRGGQSAGPNDADLLQPSGARHMLVLTLRKPAGRCNLQ
jgi:hypothetical protein